MKYLIGLVLFVFAGTASAQIPRVVPPGRSDSLTFTSGNDLLRMCTGGEVSKLRCIAYIDGVMDLIGTLQGGIDSADHKFLWKLKAIRLPVGVDDGQIRDVVVKYLVENPAERDHSAAAIIITALIQAWGCPAS